MNFQLTEESRMLAETLDRYLRQAYSMSARHAISQSNKGYSPEQWRKFAELGIIGALFKEEDGGYGGQGSDIALVFEALGKSLVIEPFLACAVLAGSVLSYAGNAEQKKWIEEIIAGERLATLAHEEPHSHYALNHVATTAKADGEGYVLNGLKVLVPLGEQASQILVSARTSGDVKERRGISIFCVSPQTPGVRVSGYNNMDGSRAAHLHLHEVRVPHTALVGELDLGLSALEHAQARGIVALSAESLGAMTFCKTATIEYLQTRHQFGQAIGRFQALQHRMADLLLEMEQARSAVINAAAHLESTDAWLRDRFVSAAKYTVGRVGALVAEESIQMHGGIGVTWELDMPHYAKRLIMIDHQLGDEDHHLSRYIQLSMQESDTQRHHA